MEIQNKILTDVKMPFCPGCGHIQTTRSISEAVQELGYTAYDVSIVSDIGCSGLVDPLFETHTIHGLHGRAPALGVGVALGINNPKKKTIVIQGDGGATIGLQHILEAARRNIDMTLVIYNNMLFGMTGGQMSGLSTNEFKDYKLSSDDADPYDVVKLAHAAGAAYTRRVNHFANFTPALKEAIETPGFSLVELSSLCTSYAMKKVSEFQEYIVEEEKFTNNRPVGHTPWRNTKSLVDNMKGLDTLFANTIEGRIGVFIAGSAGGGVQSAAQQLAQAGILAGLHTSMKGEYPITVGTGFSIAEVILSKDPIHYTGLEKPDVALIITEDGYKKIKDLLAPQTKVWMDDKAEINTAYDRKGFSKAAGKKGAALSAIAYWLEESGTFPVDALLKVVENHKYAAELQKAIQSAKEL
jgi:pyruvate/2-oxoacid:ferredoxin oxidoreductase beta subunit